MSQNIHCSIPAVSCVSRATSNLIASSSTEKPQGQLGLFGFYHITVLIVCRQLCQDDCNVIDIKVNAF